MKSKSTASALALMSLFATGIASVHAAIPVITGTPTVDSPPSATCAAPSACTLPATRTPTASSVALPATVTVAIYRGTAVVRRIYTSAALAANTYRWTWDGKNGNGILVSPGTYTVSVHATSSIGATKVTRSVTVESH